MNKYNIFVKVPFRNTGVWAGPSSSKNILPVSENDKDKTKREYVGIRLENLTGDLPKWNARKYMYVVELTDEQAKDVETWAQVRKVVKV